MRKIPTLFKRDPEDMRHVLPEVTPGCEWVLDGEGIPTRKYDGTCVMWDGKKWWARREVKPGKQPPENFRKEETDENTGKTVGWEPIGQSPFVKFFQEALVAQVVIQPPRGTFELCGPKINGNPEGYDHHVLIYHAHADWTPVDDLLTFESLRDFLVDFPHEGIVWHHPDGRMAKLKVKDFS